MSLKSPKGQWVKPLPHNFVCVTYNIVADLQIPWNILSGDNFLQNIHKRHSIVCLRGPYMEYP